MLCRILIAETHFCTLQSIRSRNYQKRLLREWGIENAVGQLISARGATVLGGPFRGMKYPRQSILSRNGIPLLFGSYELELHEVIEKAVSNCFERILDIGCAEGYYAVGLALRTGAVVYAFDCDPRERFYCRKMARLNGVESRVHVRSWCDEAILKNTSVGRCLIISDCEGYEVQLFSDNIVRTLKNCDLIIEIHGEVEDRVCDLLTKRFRHSHHVQVLQFDAARISNEVPEEWRKFAREIRPENQKWLYLTSLEV